MYMYKCPKNQHRFSKCSTGHKIYNHDINMINVHVFYNEMLALLIGYLGVMKYLHSS